MTKRFNHYLGKAGHLAMMAEFLMRGWNVAIPEVDIGDDIFVVQDDDGTLRRVQVKTSQAKIQGNGKAFSARFNVPNRQLLAGTSAVEIHFVFLARVQDSWSKPVIIRQGHLQSELQIGTKSLKPTGNTTLYLTFKQDAVFLLKRSFTGYLDNYSDFPLLRH
jgi:hypothetical protein